MADLSPGSQFGAYRIDSIAGQGGMGVVYRATQRGLDRAVALKVITPAYAHDPDFRQRFKRESKLAASIEHPNVIPVYEAGEQDEVLFLAMRYVEGTDLGSLLKREGRIEPLRATRFVAQMAAALDAAHNAGLVHRDVKPANALVAADDHVYLTDFGLTKRAASASALTKTGVMVGTVDYVAPEQVEGGAVDARTDVYSLACVLFHLLTGHVPYDKPTEMAKLFAHVHEAPPAPSADVPGLPPELDEVVARGMAKDPDDRFLSAGDLGRAGLAGAEHRPFAEPERSVARGEAAPADDVSPAVGATPPGVVVPGAGALAAAETVPPAAGAPPTVISPPAGGGGDSRKWWIGGGIAALVAVVLAIVLLAGGGGGGGGGTSTDVSEGTGAVVPVTRSSALSAAQRFTAGVDETNITNLEDLYKGHSFSETRDLETCTGSDQPMNVDAALADWQCVFDKYQDSSANLNMRLSNQVTDLKTNTMKADYVLANGSKRLASGKVSFHLIPGVDYARMDKVVFSDGTGSFKGEAASTSTPTASTNPPLTRAGAIATVNQWADYWTDENLGGLEEVFGGKGFTQTVQGPTCSGAKSPMNLDATLAEYDCDFQKLNLPEVKATTTSINTAAKTANGNWALTDKGKAVSHGTFKMHFVPQPNDANPKLDRLVLVEQQ